MFDFHTHILPEIDDGSRSIAESLAMLEELRNQGVSGIAATPHFYANYMSPDSFFAERQAAWEKIESNRSPDSPEIRLGAEVQYFEGLHRFDRIEDFCIEGTELLLVEMPVCTWTTRMISSIVDINNRACVKVLLAHIERYLCFRNQKAIDQLLQCGVFMQASTGFFMEKRRKAMRMLREGKIHFLGSDSHNMTSRKPDVASALKILARENGGEWIRKLEQREAVILHETKTHRDDLHSACAADGSVSVF